MKYNCLKMKSGLLILKGDPGYKMIKRAFELEPLRGRLLFCQSERFRGRLLMELLKDKQTFPKLLNYKLCVCMPIKYFLKSNQI